jgi:hypothetical protein
MQRIRASTYALMEGSDLTGTEQGQRSRAVRRRVSTSDDDVLQVRNRDRHPSYRNPADRIKMVRVSSLTGSSIRRRGSLTAINLAHRSARRTIRPTTSRCGTSRPRRSTNPAGKQQSHQQNSKKPHNRHLSPPVAIEQCREMIRHCLNSRLSV